MGNFTAFSYKTRYTSQAPNMFFGFDIGDERNRETLKVPNTLSSLHFVSCGTQGTETLPFSELILVFDKHIWMCIIFSIILSYIYIVYSSEFRNILYFYRKYLYFIKVLLEQGEPFPASLLKVTRFRVLIAGNLLAGLVLSNAYKSNNVYNIVRPSKPVPYTEFDELVRDKFSVYRKIDRLDYEVNPRLVEPGFSWMSNLSYTSSERGPWVEVDRLLFVVARTELWTIGIKRNIKNIVTRKTDLKFEKLKRVILESRFHRKTHELLVRPLLLLIMLEKSGLPEFQNLVIDYCTQIGAFSWKKWSKAFTQYFWENQDDIIVEDLKNCSKSAWILPKYQANKFAKMLQKRGLHSDVGKESYTKSDLLFYFTGLVPPFLLKRISVISSTGVFEWWQKFIESKTSFLQNPSQVPVKPSMKGNILVVFVVWGSLLGIALSAFSLELLCKKHHILVSGYIFCRNLMFIYYNQVKTWIFKWW